MPLYRFITPTDATTPDQRATIAAAVTQIHCDLTGAPTTFVHVFFAESAHPSDASHHLHAIHRAGRSPEVKAELLSQARRAYAAALGIHPDHVTAQLDETPAKWIMEGGAVLPEPGEEAAWLNVHTDHAPVT